MPELPEVETVARLLRPRVAGRVIESARTRWKRTLGGTSPAAFARAVRGARITGVGRRGKFLLFPLERAGAPAGSLVVHLRMTGRLQVVDRDVACGPWVRVELDLAAEARGAPGERLEFLDVRKFGRVLFREDPADVLADLGPEPLDEAFGPDDLARALRGRRRMLKPLLLDQTFLAGLGNIYVDESLFQARLHPLTASDRVSRRKARALHAAIRGTLEEAIRREGSSFDAFYRTPEGRPGSYQDQFQVYGRDGRPCRRCGRRIARLVVGQRGTHVCPGCQRPPRS